MLQVCERGQRLLEARQKSLPILVTNSKGITFGLRDLLAALRSSRKAYKQMLLQQRKDQYRHLLDVCLRYAKSYTRVLIQDSHSQAITTSRQPNRFY